MQPLPPHLFELSARIPPCFEVGLVLTLYKGRVLLVLCGPSPRREADLQAWADDHYPRAPLILAHPATRATQLARQGHPFFARVLQSGTLCFGEPLTVYPTPFTFQPLRLPDYTRAYGFYRLALNCRKEDSSLCLFLLHQCLEQATMQFILGRTGYRMDSHNLARLLRFCQVIDPDITSTIDHLSLLNRAYLAGRYEPGFRPAPEDTLHLFTAVSTLLHRLSCATPLTPFPDEEVLHPPPAAGL